MVKRKKELREIVSKILKTKSKVNLIIKTENFDDYSFLLEEIEFSPDVIVVGFERNGAAEITVFEYENYFFDFEVCPEKQIIRFSMRCEND